MTDPVTIVLAWLAGWALGVLFFGGLWWTVRTAVAAKQPALWISASMLVRTSATVAGLYLVAGHQLDRLLWCLLGFVMARFAVIRLTRPSAQAETPPPRKVSHAP